MAIEQEKFEQLIKEFTLDTDQLKTVADSFRKEMVSGLAREEGASMAMLNSYIGMPKGDEIGDFLGAVRSGGKTIMVTSLGEANDFAKEHCIGIFNDMHEALTAIKDGTLKK